MSEISFAKDKIKILLLEGIHPSAIQLFKKDGYENVVFHDVAVSTQDLLNMLPEYHFLGIRSTTYLTHEILHCAKKLVAIGCFCIGTNQVDLRAATECGIPVFNAPYANTRSVAELVLGEIILLLRGIPEKNAKAHRGIWAKSAKNSYEVRGKILGIVGYGHIGTQLGILAESIGMQVYYYDIETKLALGNARAAHSLNELLAMSDVISLHVPATAETNKMIGSAQLERMKNTSFLVNASRGSVVDIDALTGALAEKHLAGAAIDVFPEEPSSNHHEFSSPLQAFDNVILTPHIGGSTAEAQQNIGLEVTQKLIKYSNNGSTTSAVNFPEVVLPEHKGLSRVLHIHHNVPGVLKHINAVFSDQQINVAGQYLQTNREIGYMVMDVEQGISNELLNQLKLVPGTIKTRLLY